MCCIPIVNGDTVTGHICIPNGHTEPVAGRRKKRFWCFKCRKRLLHTRMAFRHAQPSWYEDNYWWECPRCHQDNVLFPGREWVYDE